jgi:hypothetical protein
MKSFSPIFSLCLTALIFCSGCVTAQRGTVLRAEAAMADDKYDVALRRLNLAESYSQTPPVVGAQLHYLKGICYENLHQPGEAKAMFKFVADHFPDTDYGYLAKEKIAKAGKE